MRDKIMSMINEAKFECELNKIEKEAKDVMFMNDVYMFHVDKEYEDRLRDMELITNVRQRMLELTLLITKVKDIEAEAIADNQMSIMWKCENLIAKMMGQMQLMRNKYDL